MRYISLLSCLGMTLAACGGGSSGGEDDGPPAVLPPMANNAPVAQTQTVSTDEDTNVSGQLDGSDADGDRLTFVLASGASTGTATVAADGSFDYAPDPDFSGTDSFTFQVNDGQDDSVPATASVTINPVNDAPLTENDTAETDEELAVDIVVLVNDFDVEGDGLTVSLDKPANGSATLNPDYSVTYVPDANFYGTDSFSYVANDGNEDSDPATITVTVNPVNDAPVASDDAVDTEEDRRVEIAVLANDFDADDDTLIVTVDSPDHGIATVSADNEITYKPDMNYDGPDSFSYTISDADGETDSADVSVTVTPLNLVVYHSDRDTELVSELYFVDLANPGVPIRLNSALVEGGDVAEFVVSPDGTRVLYVADQEIEGIFNLYVADLSEPGVSTKISTAVDDFSFSHDGTQVAYVAERFDIGGDEIEELYVADLGAPSVSTLINHPVSSMGPFAWSPDGVHVFYRAEEENDFIDELFSVDPATPGIATKLHEELVGQLGGLEGVKSFAVSPDGSQIAYLAEQETEDTRELFWIDLANPGSSTKLHPDFVAPTRVSSFVFSPDGSKVIYQADPDIASVEELYSVELPGPGKTTPGLPQKIHPDQSAGRRGVGNYALSSDGAKVVYRADQDRQDVMELYLVDLTDPTVSTKLHPDLTSGGGVSTSAFTADNDKVVFNIDDGGGDFELFQSDLVTSQVTRVHEALSGEDVLGFEFSQDGTGIVYRFSQETGDEELYLVDLPVSGAGPSTSVRLDGGIGRPINEFVVIP